MCGIIPSSGQPESLFTSEGKNLTLTQMNTTVMGISNAQTIKAPTHGFSGHVMTAIPYGMKNVRNPRRQHSGNVMPQSHWSFTPHHGQGKVPRITLSPLLQAGHLRMTGLAGTEFTLGEPEPQCRWETQSVSKRGDTNSLKPRSAGPVK